MADTRKIGVIVADLKKMKVALVGEDGDGTELTEEELKTMDKFQKKKRELNITLKKLREDTAKLTELKRAKGDERDKNVIGLMADNNKTIHAAGEQWKELKQILQDDSKNEKMAKKLGEKEISNRSRTIQLLGQEICDLTALNNRVKDSGPKNVEELTQATNKTDSKKDSGRKTDRQNRRKARGGAGKTGASGKGGAMELDDSDFRDVAPASQQEQKFMDQVQANVDDQNEILDQIAKGVDELKELSLDMNKQLTLQNTMIGEVSDEMDKTIEKFKSANGKLKAILDDNGGMTRWCPMIVCLCLLLALAGYLFNMF
jgi:methyl-accepting chemotaxis protein